MGIFDKDIGKIQFVPQQGVDNIAAGLIEKAGTLSIEAYKGKVAADLEKKFKNISVAREQGEMSSDRARAEAANAVADATSKLPGFSGDFRKKAAAFFGDFGPGQAALERSPGEVLNAALLKDRALSMQRAGLDFNDPDDNASYDFMLKAKAEREFYENVAGRQAALDKIDANNISKYSNSAVTEFITMLMSDLTKEVEDTGSLQEPEVYLSRIVSFSVKLDSKLAANGVGGEARKQYRAQLEDRFKLVRQFIGINDLQKIMERDGKLLRSSMEQIGFQMFPLYMLLSESVGPAFATKFLELYDKYTQSPDKHKKFLRGFFTGNQSIGSELLDQFLTDRSKVASFIFESMSRISKGQINNTGDLGLAIDIINTSKNNNAEGLQPTIDVVATNAPAELPDSIVQDNLPKWITGTNFQLTQSAVALGNLLSSYDLSSLNFIKKEDGTFDIEGLGSQDEEIVRMHKGIVNSSGQRLRARQIVDHINELIKKAETNGVSDRLIIDQFEDLVQLSTIRDQATRLSAWDALRKGSSEALGSFIEGIKKLPEAAKGLSEDAQKRRSDNTNTNIFRYDANGNLITGPPE